MKHGWEYKKFTDVCDVQYGFAFDSKFFTDDENAMPLIRIRDVMRGYSETFYNGEIPNGYLINEGDYLVGMDGEFNIGRWGKRPGLLNQRVCKMSSSSKLLDNQYMYYFMKVCLKSIEDETPFVTVKHLSAKRINLIEIPLPPLLTQQSIASELDKINELIRLKREQLKDYDNLAQSIFYEMFGDPIENEKGWEVKKLSSITSKIGSGATPKGGNESYKTEGISLIRSLNVHNNEFLYKDLAHIDNEQAEALSNVEIKEYDVLLNITGASVARCCIVPDDVIPARVNQHVCIVRTIQEKALPIFINRVLTNENFQANLLRLARSKAATREALPKSIVDNIQVPLPPLSLQQLFAQRIELIEQQKAEIQTTIADLETLLASRMQYWFD